MIKRLTAIFAIAALIVSCQKDMNEGSDNPVDSGSSIPAGFTWEMTRDVAVTVGMPAVEGAQPDYAVVRIFSSPNLVDENVVAKGVVKSSQPTFSAVMTLPADVENIYVQTTLPDGTVSVEMRPAAASVSVSGAAMKQAALSGIRSGAAVTRGVGDMPDFPVLTVKSEADFAPQAVIRETPAGVLQLGASWAQYPAAEYYIPAGADIRDNINMYGTFPPYPEPVLYVAGRLTLSKLGIGQAILAVLPGGEVSIRGGVDANSQPNASYPAVYVFEGGTFKAEKANFSCKQIVNQGTFVVDGKLDLNSGVVFCNTASARLQAEDIEVTNSSSLFNDGTLVAEEIELNSQARFTNGGSLQVDDELVFTNTTIFYQKGDARIEELKADGSGTCYIECYTITAEIESEGGAFNIAAGAGLDTQQAEFNNSKMSLGAGAIFTAEEFNIENKEEKGNNTFVSEAGADQLPAVIVFSSRARSSHVANAAFSGRMEVVYTNWRNYVIGTDCLKGGAVMRPEQTVVLPSSHCNGDKKPVEPEPEPEPEYNEITGAAYTYCFEDGWPWIGDYDMNDVVVVASVTRRADKQSGKIGSLRIDWELKAAGAAHLNAFALQLDKVKASEVASVETTNNSFGRGAFAGPGLEAGADRAIVPLFNTAQEILGEGTYINTAQGSAVPTVKHTTSVTFAQPVDAEAVTESAVNAFIVVNSKSSGAFTRDTEIHMPTFKPTQFAVVSGSTFTQEEPYKYYIPKGDGMKNNYMMWALRIPGDFRYPLERRDIRDVYTYFNAWAASGGVQHKDWYKDEADESLLY